MIQQNTAPYAALVLRLTLGVMFIAAAAVVQFLLGDGAYALSGRSAPLPAVRAV